MNIQGCFFLGLTGLISLLSKGLKSYKHGYTHNRLNPTFPFFEYIPRSGIADHVVFLFLIF